MKNKSSNYINNFYIIIKIKSKIFKLVSGAALGI